MNYEPQDYEKMENLIMRNIENWMTIKSTHGFIYEIRNTVIGDTNTFNRNGHIFTVNLNTLELGVSDILNSDKDLLVKGDEISSKIIENIDNHIDEMIKHSQISTTIEAFKGFVKVVIENSVIITNEHKTYIKYGVAVSN